MTPLIEECIFASLTNILRYIEVPFIKSRIADVVYHTLRVDTEPKRGGTTKTLAVEGNKLVVYN